MKFPWFKRFGILYLPGSLAGWGVMAIAIGYCVYIFLDIDKRSHSVSDTLINFILNLVLVFLAYMLIAYLTSKPLNTKK